MHPRHLAGDDDELADRVAMTLTEAGWSTWTTARSTLLHLSPRGLVGAEWVRGSHDFLLGELPVAWHISARTHASSAVMEWNAYFTTGTPPEAIGDFLLAVDARTDPAVNYAGRDAVLDAVCALGWARDLDTLDSRVWDPGMSAGFVWGELPELVRDGDPRPDLYGWQAWAEPVIGEPYQWTATFSASVPHDLVAAFASSLASPVPVLRRNPPENADGRLFVTPAL
ncbi:MULTISPECIES: DUF317 domain-containing protein [unclassified Streptomyces]|uniref:DUF317 domain-containing protein n=1 Tax=unclassified Streptomyces TaxID=2593676 RepID=UPI0029669498|nr:DUF317 domain-containing protein [Streptomyces sp. SJL17-1]